jgi:hypothetical protein
MSRLKRPGDGWASSPEDMAQILAQTSFPDDHNKEPLPEIPSDPEPMNLWSPLDVSVFRCQEPAQCSGIEL